MEEFHTSLEKKIDYPAELTFKVIFRNRAYTEVSIQNILSESGLRGSINHRESKNSTFISYTVTAVFPSNETLNAICRNISSLDGYMTMF